MYDSYPQEIINYGVKDSWKTAPLSFEICGTFRNWKEKQGYNRDDVKYIFDETLKWHISSFNAKSSPVPVEWEPQVERWLNRMGYRFVLRKFSFSARVHPSGRLDFTSWWENKGVAPSYKKYRLALRLRRQEHAVVLPAEVDIRDWLPGDNLYDDAVFVPIETPPGDYELDLALVDEVTFEPAIQLAIEGRRDDGWYPLGALEVLPRFGNR